MKRKKFFILIFLPLLFTSCSMIIDKDTTANVSKVSYKPVMKLNGEAIMSLPVGGNYTEQGVTAVAGDTTLNYEIVSGSVDVNTPGFYVVTYKATNQYGWSSYAYRAVLVYSGDPYHSDIEGNYKVGFQFHSTVSKYSVPGYWQITNVWASEGVEFPVIFADTGDGVNFGIVPGEHETKGRYSGTALLQGNYLIFRVQLEELDEPNEFKWQKE